MISGTPIDNGKCARLSIKYYSLKHENMKLDTRPTSVHYRYSESMIELLDYCCDTVLVFLNEDNGILEIKLEDNT